MLGGEKLIQRNGEDEPKTPAIALFFFTKDTEISETKTKCENFCG